MKTLILITAILCATRTARAQAINVGALDGTTNLATVSSGLENALVVGAGYAHVSSAGQHPVLLGADITLAGAEMDVHDFALRAGVFAPLLRHERWNLSGGLRATIRGTHTDINQMIDLGTDAAVVAGYYAPHWFAAAEGGFDWAAVTHIAPSDTYRMLVYADAKDGWYGNTGGLFRYGVQGGVTFGGNDVVLRAGQLRNIAGDPPLFPIYGTLSYDRRW